jgi:outer membrane protein assembly factor BamB
MSDPYVADQVCDRLDDAVRAADPSACRRRLVELPDLLATAAMDDPALEVIRDDIETLVDRVVEWEATADDTSDLDAAAELPRPLERELRAITHRVSRLYLRQADLGDSVPSGPDVGIAADGPTESPGGADGHDDEATADGPDPGEPSTGDWRLFRGDAARTGYRPGADVPTDRPARRWTAEVGSPVLNSEVRSSPAVADGRVAVGCENGDLSLFDAATGEPGWTFSTRLYVRSSPAMDDETVFVGGWDETLYAVDIATGEEVWSFETGAGIRSSPLVADGTVYVGSRDGSVYAVDATRGLADWQFETDGWVRSSPALRDETVLFGSRDGNLYAVDAADGTERWRFGTGGWIRGSPAVSDGLAVVGSSDHSVYAVDIGTGEQRWATETGGRVRSSPAVAGEAVVVVGSSDGRLHALDAGTGDCCWTFETDDEVLAIAGSRRRDGRRRQSGRPCLRGRHRDREAAMGLRDGRPGPVVTGGRRRRRLRRE